MSPSSGGGGPERPTHALLGEFERGSAVDRARDQHCQHERAKAIALPRAGAAAGKLHSGELAHGASLAAARTPLYSDGSLIDRERTILRCVCRQPRLRTASACKNNGGPSSVRRLLSGSRKGRSWVR